ncbi:MAG: NUDIX domain-containing protein [Chloroflexi bacterium]|nr:NUDIX domain-containing protein [Chloroflexota bacterium]
MRSHFTSTAFVVHQGRTLLHWHAKIQQWMPPGGHLDPNEDPVAGALREVREETGLNVELFSPTTAYDFAQPAQLLPPVTILVEDVEDEDGPHHHIDFIYFARPKEGEALRPVPETKSWTWVDAGQIERGESLSHAGGSAPVPEDVAVLALAAIRIEQNPRSQQRR